MDIHWYLVQSLTEQVIFQLHEYKSNMIIFLFNTFLFVVTVIFLCLFHVYGQ